MSDLSPRTGPDTVVVPGGFLLRDSLAALGDRLTVIFYDPLGRGQSAPVVDSTHVTMARVVASPVEVGGAAMERGDWVLVPFPAANRDPEQFERADEVLIDRLHNRHAAFGLGIHRCLGSNLARLELTVAVREWLARFPEFEVADPEGVRWSTGQVRGPRSLPLKLG